MTSAVKLKFAKRATGGSAFGRNPQTTFLKIATALGTQENAWLRQVGGYWEMAASFVLHGTLNRDLFLEPSFSGEMFVFFGKVEPFVKEVREKMQNPNIFGNVEKLIATSEGAPERLKQTQERLAMLRQSGAIGQGGLVILGNAASEHVGSERPPYAVSS